jgi:hypothetical protein
MDILLPIWTEEWLLLNDSISKPSNSLGLGTQKNNNKKIFVRMRFYSMQKFQPELRVLHSLTLSVSHSLSHYFDFQLLGPFTVMSILQPLFYLAIRVQEGFLFV